ncbi:hypothetical protein J532_3491 [Acinetobacter baumannii 940793]|nr:hypothetical protein J644_3771 [Acinetobacter baumannii 480175]KCX82255.1 hypothetical protein J532_3491 [Acinetobacter baumannii 940793]
MNKTKGCLIANFATVPKLIASDKIEDILQQFEQYQAPAPKWTNADVQP